MIYTPFGCECMIVGRAGAGPMLYGEVLTVAIDENEACRQFRACELRADDGIKEIAKTVEALAPDAQEPAF